MSVQAKQSNDPYIETYKHGNLYFNIGPKLVPLVLWGILAIYYYIPYYKKNNYSYIYLLILCLPIIMIVLELVFQRTIIFSSQAIKPILWERCFTEITTDKNVKGIWDYKCGFHQISFLQNILNLLQNKFYYLNYALFILILIYRRILTNKSQNGLTNSLITFICIALLIGTIGILPSSYSINYIWSLMIAMGYSTLLNMNIAAFLIILYALNK